MVNRFYDPVMEPTLWLMVSIIFCIFAVYFIYKYRKIEPEGRSFIFGLIIFSITFAIARLIETIRRYFYINDYYDIVDSNFTITGINLLLRLSYYIIAWTGITVFFFVFEKYIMEKKTKFLITVSSSLEGIFSCLLYFTAEAFWNFTIVVILFFGVAIVPIILFLYLSIKGLYLSNKIAWIINTIGFLFFLLGVIGDLPESYIFVQNIPGILLHYFNPIAESLGAILMGIGFSIIYKNV